MDSYKYSGIKLDYLSVTVVINQLFAHFICYHNMHVLHYCRWSSYVEEK